MPMPKKSDPQQTCHHCGTMLNRKRINGRLEDRNAFLRRIYCNRSCMAAAFVKDTPSKSALCKRVTKYRGSCCEVCGATMKLHAHHIDGNRLNGSPQNIQTLCASCHISHHHHARRAGKTVVGRMV